jgi:hypothetical protein
LPCLCVISIVYFLCRTCAIVRKSLVCLQLVPKAFILWLDPPPHGHTHAILCWTSFHFWPTTRSKVLANSHHSLSLVMFVYAKGLADTHGLYHLQSMRWNYLEVNIYRSCVVIRKRFLQLFLRKERSYTYMYRHKILPTFNE